MKILFVHHGQGSAGGAPVSLINLILGLKQLDTMDITVLCLDGKMGRFFEEKAAAQVAILPDPLKTFGKVLIWGIGFLEWRKLAFFILECLRLPSSIRRQWALFRKLRPDIVHLNSAVLFSSAFAARFAGIPVVWHIREIVAGTRWSPRRLLAGCLIRTLSDRVIAISPVEAQRLGPDRRGRVSVVYNSVDLDRFAAEIPNRNQARSLLGFSHDERLVVSLNGVSHWKGTAELLKAMSFTSADTHLLVVGPALDNPTAVANWRTRMILGIEDLLVELHIQSFWSADYADRVRLAWAKAPQDRIHFLGPTENILLPLSAADVVAFSGVGPHFPRPVFEAWAMKKPVVVFDIMGVREHVNDGVDAMVVKERTGAAFGQALARLLDDRELMRALGEHGHRKAKTLFDQTGNAQQVFSIYETLLVSLNIRTVGTEGHA